MGSGIRQIAIRDPQSGSSFPAIVQYPSEASSTGTSIGPYHFNATLDAPIAPGRFPVCVISHGGGGSHLLYRSIAGYLARKGFIVVSPEHPGDNRNDGSLSNTDTAAANRPRERAARQEPGMGSVSRETVRRMLKKTISNPGAG